jgi:hypothetical protein
VAKPRFAQRSADAQNRSRELRNEHQRLGEVPPFENRERWGSLTRVGQPAVEYRPVIHYTESYNSRFAS